MSKLNCAYSSCARIAIAATLVLGGAQAAFAQDAAASRPAAETESSGTAIVVTARKREENLLETPLAITAYSGEGLEARGMDTLSQMAEGTPGINVNQNGSGRNDRSYQQFILRGFTPSSTKQSTASMFIDGAPVSSSSALSSISDPARIEILKGPQAAYFGRSTFAGAINVVNKVPGNEWHGSLKGMLGTRNNYSAHADIEGPIVEDLLAFRVSGDASGKDGSYKNAFNPGETLGDQSSRSVSAMLSFTPSSDLKIKAFGLYSRDDDGPSAQGQLSAYEVRGADGSLVSANQSNCTLTGSSSGVAGDPSATSVLNPSFCGTTPRLATGPSANTQYSGVVEDWLKSQSDSRLFGNDGVDHYGLLRNYYHGHVNVDWDVGDTGVTLSSLTAYNREESSVLTDLDNQGTTAVPNSYYPAAGQSYFDYPYLVEAMRQDFSQELRAAYDDGGPLQAMLGASYLNATMRSALGGGLLPSASVSEIGKTRSRTFGLFGALTYEFFDGFSVSAEGRYQIDKLYAYSQPSGTTVTNSAIVDPGYYEGGSLLLSKSYKNFLPRVIVKYETPSGLMGYASWSKGVNPGLFNTEFLSLSDAVVEQAINEGVRVAVDPEKVTNYEVGLKGGLLNNRLTFSLALYYAQWRNQINAISLWTTDPTTGLPAVLQGSANSGSVDMRGVELETNWRVNSILSINAAGSINDTDIQSYTNPSVSRLTGVFDYSGNELPQTSKYSGTVGFELRDYYSSASDGQWFARADYNFKSGMWSNAANVVKTQDSHKVNVRLGVDIDRFSFEVFGTNIFNNRAYTSIADFSVLTNGFPYSSTYSALVVGLPDLRTLGAKVSYKF
ncbi:TonB-dependent receptor [Novosphingobium profundi]|uniref:TonB-dependent receptor n=1 Tax=Novosphingobium profundi TaxID=1774954 RepID=UPI001BDB23E7|nr:TonB-dependent receptor [Novosphingobium profundi]MBT0669259.1 TonB-dependent receptor [Novosphingobium profundi]